MIDIAGTAKTATFRIWIGGDYDTAKAACRRFTMRGLCVAISQTDFIYTMGAESGVCVTLINYPRFPMEVAELGETARTLGSFLCEELYQGSFSIEGPDETVWFSRKDTEPMNAQQSAKATGRSCDHDKSAAKLQIDELEAGG